MELTIKQFNELSTKEDLQKVEKRMNKKFDAVDKKIDDLATSVDERFDAAFLLFATKEDLKDLKQELREDMVKETNKILNAIDCIVKKHSDFEIEMVANQGTHNRLDEKIIKTDRRVKILEKKLGVSNVGI